MAEKCVFDKGRHCQALKHKKCDGCGFYKTEEQLRKSRERSEARIASLDEKEREKINGEYSLSDE